MRRILFILAVMYLLLPLSSSYGFSEKGQDCTKCHTLTNDEATALLKDLIPNIKVLDVKAGPVKGVWEVVIETGGKKGLVYVHYSKNHLLSGAVYAIKEKKNLSQERLLEMNKVDVAQIPLDDALVMGDKDAKYKVIVFDDPD